MFCACDIGLYLLSYGEVCLSPSHHLNRDANWSIHAERDWSATDSSRPWLIKPHISKSQQTWYAWTWKIFEALTSLPESPLFKVLFETSSDLTKYSFQRDQVTVSTTKHSVKMSAHEPIVMHKLSSAFPTLELPPGYVLVSLHYPFGRFVLCSDILLLFSWYTGSKLFRAWGRNWRGAWWAAEWVLVSAEWWRWDWFVGVNCACITRADSNAASSLFCEMLSWLKSKLEIWSRARMATINLQCLVEAKESLRDDRPLFKESGTGNLCRLYLTHIIGKHLNSFDLG